MTTIEINRLTVNMTIEDAVIWNDGAWPDDMPVEVLVPTTHGAGSFVRDGDVVMVQGLPTDEWQAWLPGEPGFAQLNNHEAFLVIEDRRFRLDEQATTF